jgi:hypothetical protein
MADSEKTLVDVWSTAFKAFNDQARINSELQVAVATLSVNVKQSMEEYRNQLQGLVKFHEKEEKCHDEIVAQLVRDDGLRHFIDSKVQSILNISKGSEERADDNVEELMRRIADVVAAMTARIDRQDQADVTNTNDVKSVVAGLGTNLTWKIETLVTNMAKEIEGVCTTVSTKLDKSFEEIDKRLTEKTKLMDKSSEVAYLKYYIIAISLISFVGMLLGKYLIGK